MSVKFIIKRFFSFYIDVAICSIFTMGLVFFFNINVEYELYSSHSIVLLQIIISFAYFTLLEYFLGKTLGKYIFKLKLSYSGLPEKHLINCIFRTFCRFIPFEPISIFLNSENKMLHDKCSKIKVDEV